MVLSMLGRFVLSATNTAVIIINHKLYLMITRVHPVHFMNAEQPGPALSMLKVFSRAGLQT